MTKLYSRKYLSGKNNHGLAFLELVIAISIIVSLLVLGTAAYRGINESAQNSAIANDIKVLEDAAELAESKGSIILGEAANLSNGDRVRNQKGETIDSHNPDHVLYTINAANIRQYTKGLKYPIENYLIDNKKLVYYKGTFAAPTNIK